jgi:uncharacterized protein YndB with AHSA1/START domain
MPGVQPGTESVEHTIRIAARPETVFSYFTDPSRMMQWFGVEAMLDPRPGGICRITFDSSPSFLDAIAPTLDGFEPSGAEPLGQTVMSGRFVEVEPHHRITFTWGWEQDLLAVPPHSTQVSVSLVEDGDGTLLSIVHERLPGPSAAFHAAGWVHYLARLAAVAGGEQPGSDPWQRDQADHSR